MQSLLFGAGLAWGLFPQWGALVFGAVYGLMLLTIVAKRRAAGKHLAAQREPLAASLTPEGLAWASQHPLFYVWPATARAWARTMKTVSVMMVILSVWFAVRGFVFLQPWVWLCLIPAAAVLVFGFTWGDKLDFEGLLEDEKWAANRRLHDEVKRVLAVQSLAGKWASGGADLNFGATLGNPGP